MLVFLAVVEALSVASAARRLVTTSNDVARSDNNADHSDGMGQVLKQWGFRAQGGLCDQGFIISPMAKDGDQRLHELLLLGRVKPRHQRDAAAHD